MDDYGDNYYQDHDNHLQADDHHHHHQDDDHHNDDDRHHHPNQADLDDTVTQVEELLLTNNTGGDDRSTSSSSNSSVLLAAKRDKYGDNYYQYYDNHLQADDDHHHLDDDHHNDDDRHHHPNQADFDDTVTQAEKLLLTNNTGGDDRSSSSRSNSSVLLAAKRVISQNSLDGARGIARSLNSFTGAGGDYNLTSSSSSSNNYVLYAGDRGESSRCAAVFLLVNAALGAGILNFPQAFDQAGGISVALLVQLVLLCCVCFGLLVLAHSSWQVHAATLHDTMAGTCGTKGSLFCSLLIAIYCFGTCVTFLIIIGDQFDRVLMSLVGPSFCQIWYMNRRFTITVSAIVFILPMCYSRKIDFLKYARYRILLECSLGVVAVLYVVGLVVVQYYTGNFVPGPIKTAPDHWTDVFYVVPVICFGYQCHVSAVPIYSCMSDRRINSFTSVVVATLVICSLAYTLTGTYGYLTFGGKVSSDILEKYGGADVAVLVGIVAIAVKTVTTYPILLFCGREAVSNVWVGMTYEDYDPSRERLRRIIISTTWFAATIFIAVISPDIGIVIDALGSLAAVFIFILPGLCLMQTCLQRDPCLMVSRMRLYVLVSLLFAALGAFIMGVVLVQTIERIYNNPEPSPTLCTLAQ